MFFNEVKMGLDLTPKCKKCGQELDLKAMRALPEGKGFVCQNCYENAGKPSFTVNKDRLRELPSTSVSQQNSSSTSASIDKDKIFNEKEYQCTSCNYQFKRSGDINVEVCPYCGKRGVIIQKVEETAEEFLG